MKSSIIILVIFIIIGLYFLYNIYKRNSAPRIRKDNSIPVVPNNGLYGILIVETVTYKKEIKADSYEKALQIASEDFINNELSWKEIDVDTQVQ